MVPTAVTVALSMLMVALMLFMMVTVGFAVLWQLTAKQRKYLFFHGSSRAGTGQRSACRPQTQMPS